MFLIIIIFLLVLSLLVFVHEIGHFLTAKKLGVRAEEFGFGFPPRIWGIYRTREGKWKQVWGAKEVFDAVGTVYSVNWIPLGGFVKIKGEDGEHENDPDSFSNKPVWKRATILSAGVAMNVVLAAVLFSFGFMVGFPQSVDGIDGRAVVSERKIQVVEVLPSSPASRAGIKTADVVLSVEGKEFIRDVDLQEFTNNNSGRELFYKIQRGGDVLDFKITPEPISEEAAEIGIGIVNVGLVKYPWYLAVWKGIKMSVVLIWVIVAAFYELIKNLIIGAPVSVDVAGPIGIASLTGQFARMGFVYLLQFIALLSVNLAVINFLPIPALDGGRVLFLIIEKIKGRPVKRELEAVIHNTGFILLMILILFITFKDIARFGEKFKIFFENIF